MIANTAAGYQLELKIVIESGLRGFILTHQRNLITASASSLAD
jgi:hypothetical protein